MTKPFVTAIVGLLLFLEGSILSVTWLAQHGLTDVLHVQPVLGIILVMTGVVFVVKALKRSNITKQVTEIQMQQEGIADAVMTPKEGSVIERNNELIKEWSHTYRMREKLKMVKAAASEENKGI